MTLSQYCRSKGPGIQAEVARRAGLSEAYISLIRKRYRKVTWSTALAIEAATDGLVTPGDLPLTNEALYTLRAMEGAA